MKFNRDSAYLIAVPAVLLAGGLWWIFDRPSWTDGGGGVRFELTDGAGRGDAGAAGGPRGAASIGTSSRLDGADPDACGATELRGGVSDENRPFAIWNGRVLARDGSPIDGATVIIKGRRNLRLGDGTDIDEAESIEAKAGKDGAVAFEMKPGYVYDLRVKAPGFGVEEFRVQGQMSQDLVLDQASAVEGRVLVGAGTPLSGATVTFQNGLEVYEVTTDADGRFRFEGVSAHPAQVQVTDNRFLARSVSLDRLNPGEAYTLSSLFLDAGAHLSGTVLVDGATPGADMAVSLLDRATQQVVSSGRTDLFGNFSFGSLSPLRDYLITTVGWGFRADRPAQSYLANDHVTINVSSTWNLTVRLLSPTGVASGATVRLRRHDGLPIYGSTMSVSSTTTGVGLAGFTALSRDIAYRVVVSQPGSATLDVGPVTSVDGSDLYLPIDLLPGRLLLGQVLDEGGQPVPGAIVRAQRADAVPAPPLFTQADAAGAFAFDALASGTVSLVTFVPGYDDTRVVVDVGATGVETMVVLTVVALNPVGGTLSGASGSSSGLGGN